jgi:hypothetical protein
MTFLIPSRSLVGCRCAPKNTGNNDQTFIEVQVINDAVIAHPAPPRCVFALEPFNVALKGIGLYGNQHRLNARLIFLRELLEVFLCWTGD